MGTLLRCLCLLTLGARCARDDGADPVALDTFAVDEPDGRVSLYRGQFIGEKLRQGVNVEALTNPQSFLRVRVPRALVEEARATGRKLLSLEERRAGVELLLHEVDPPTGLIKNTIFLPGAPWLTGYASVVVGAGGRLAGGVRIIKWTGALPLTARELVWGLFECPGMSDCPTLQYANPNPCGWPPLPADWMLLGPTGQPATLADGCGR
jgi:hypothetical protein